jgi:hypothetical protein
MKSFFIFAQLWLVLSVMNGECCWGEKGLNRLTMQFALSFVKKNVKSLHTT